MKAFFSGSLKQIDYFAKPVRLSFEKERKFRTVFGGMISLIIYGVTLSLFINMGTNLLNKNLPKISSTNFHLVEQPLLDLKKLNVLFAFFFLDKDFQLVDDPSYFNFELFKFTVNRTKAENSVSKDILEMKTCDNYLRNFKENGFENDYYSNNLQKAFCIDPNLQDSIIGGSFGGNFFSNILINLNKCQNTTNFEGETFYLKNKTDSNKLVICKPLDEINKKIHGGYFELYYIDKNIHLEDYSEPITKYLSNYFIKLDSKSQKFVDVYFKTINIASDVGLIFESRDNIYDLVFDYFREQIMVLDKENINVIEFYINSSFNLLNFDRVYMKIQDFAATIGGFIKVLLIIGSILNSLFNKTKIHEKMINAFFSIRYSFKSSSLPIENNFYFNNWKSNGKSNKFKNQLNRKIFEVEINKKNKNHKNLKIPKINIVSNLISEGDKGRGKLSFEKIDQDNTIKLDKINDEYVDNSVNQINIDNSNFINEDKFLKINHTNEKNKQPIFNFGKEKIDSFKKESNRNIQNTVFNSNIENIKSNHRIIDKKLDEIPKIKIDFIKNSETARVDDSLSNYQKMINAINLNNKTNKKANNERYEECSVKCGDKLDDENNSEFEKNKNNKINSVLIKSFENSFKNEKISLVNNHSKKKNKSNDNQLESFKFSQKNRNMENSHKNFEIPIKSQSAKSKILFEPKPEMNKKFHNVQIERKKLYSIEWYKTLNTDIFFKCCPKIRKEILFYDKALKKLNFYLDFLEIIKILQEYQTLKKILLSKNKQILLSVYQQPIIDHEDIHSFDFENDVNNNNSDKFFNSYKIAKKKSVNDKIFRKLIENMNVNLRTTYDEKLNI